MGLVSFYMTPHNYAEDVFLKYKGKEWLIENKANVRPIRDSVYPHHVGIEDHEWQVFDADDHDAAIPIEYWSEFELYASNKILDYYDRNY